MSLFQNRINYTLINILIIFSFIKIANCQNTGNFLILKNIHPFQMYNSYEQKLTQADSLYFIDNVPLQIINENAFLSDNYTPCIIVKFENKIFYIVKENSEQSINFFSNSGLNYIQNADVLQDTIQLLSNKTVFFNSGENENKTQFNRGTKLKRIFKKGDRYFIKTLSIPIQYGWVELNNASDWKTISQNSGTNIDTTDEVEFIIKNQIEKVNEIIYKLYSHFNKLEMSDLSAPFWHIEKKGNKYYCELINKSKDINFTESTNLLIGKLELKLAKYNYHVEKQKNEIIIHPN